MSNKTYILLKDIFDANKGTEFIGDSFNGYKYKDIYLNEKHTPPDAVEGNEEWFLEQQQEKEEQQPKEKDVFQWNEETAKEYGKFCVENNSYLQWNDFKQSKSTPKEDKIEVSRFQPHETLKGNKWDSYFYQFCLSKLIPPEKYEAVKKCTSTYTCKLSKSST